MTTKRGRPPTGCPHWNPEKQIWEARVMLPTGQRRPVAMPGIGEHEVERAHAKAKDLAITARDGGWVPEEASETVNEWFERWAEVREKKGLRTVRNDRARFKKWIAPTLGTKPVTAVRRTDIEEVVQALDRSVLAGELRWKTSINCWGVVTKMFADSCRSKVLGLRVRQDNPARDVEGPDRGVERSGPYLFPNEFLAIMRCERVPVRWKRIFMLATYLYLRGGELEALEWNSVDFVHGYVLIHQAVDGDTGEIKSTKTKDVRKVPIDRALLPLLEKMHKEAAGEGRVVSAMPPREEWAERLRKYLGWAGVDRPDLLADDETRRQLSFHDLRHTGITWRAVRGDEPLKIQRAAGHDDLRTTQKYINEAQVFEGTSFGEPFPGVALSCLSIFGSNNGCEATMIAQSTAFSRTGVASPGGFEHESASPETSAVEAPSPEKTAAPAPDDGHGASTIVDEAGPRKTESDEALKLAIKAAVDAGDTERAAALLALLKPKASAASRPGSLKLVR